MGGLIAGLSNIPTNRSTTVRFSIPLDFVHVFTGCDTTSALFWQGKNKMLIALEKDVALVDVATTFLKPDVSH